MSIITPKISEAAHAAAEKAADGQVGSRLTRAITEAVLKVVDGSVHHVTAKKPSAVKKVAGKVKTAAKRTAGKKR